VNAIHITLLCALWFFVGACIAESELPFDKDEVTTLDLLRGAGLVAIAPLMFAVAPIVAIVARVRR
jgi:hypothetical protein